MKNLFFIILILIFSACTGKDTLVRPHEQNKTATNSEVRVDTKSLSIEGLSPASTLELVRSLRGNEALLLAKIVSPLERQIINVDYITNPENIVGDFSSWLNVYTEALLVSLGSQPSIEALNSLNRFIELASRNCDENLNGCSTYKIFRLSSNSGRLMIYKANMIGKKIDECELNKKNCKALVQEKYRLLMLSSSLYSSQIPNVDFIVSYIEHSHLVGQLPQTMYLRQNHAQTFTTVVQFFDPDKTPRELSCKIIKNFNIWTYTRLSIGASRQSMKKLFQLSTGCDLYDGKQLTENFKRSILEIQLSENQTGALSFFKRFTKIKEDPEAKALFGKYLPTSLLDKATKKKSNGTELDGSFYDEYFYTLDRLYNGHISIEDAQQILISAKRSYDRLIEAFNIYVKMQLIASVIETKDYMRVALAEDKNDVATDKIFERAIEGSEAFAQKWRSLRSGVQALQSAIRYIYETPGLATEAQLAGYNEINKQVRHLPSTIKYIATYPAMMSLAHYLALQEGTKSAPTWWGGTVTHSSSTIYENMWKGIEKPWFQFSDDEPLNKFYLIYAFDYALRSDFVTIQAQITQEVLSKSEKLNQYIQTMIEKYLKSERDTLSKNYRDELLQSVSGDVMTSRQKLLCEYELDPKNTNGPVLDKNLEDLKFQIHSGLGRKAAVNYSTPSVSFFDKAGPILVQINDRMMPKLQLVKTLVKVAQKNGVPSDVVEKANQEIAQTEKLIKEIVSNFTRDIQFHTSCLMRLQLVESYYQYLAYESEKAYLGDVWEKLRSIQPLKGEELERAVSEINNLPGVFQDEKQIISGNNVNQIHFDRITKDKSFIYSRFDIYVRLRNLLLSGDIMNYSDSRFVKIEEEWAKRFPFAMKRPIQISRQWQFRNPPLLEQSEIVNNRSKDMNLNWMASKEDFIKQGMRALRGTKDQSHVEWYLDNNQDIAPWVKALDAAIYIYIAQEKTTPDHLKMAAQDLHLAMKNIIYSVSMNAIDVELASVFGYTSKIPLKSLVNIIVDGGERETLFPHSYLYESFKIKMSMNSNMLELKPAQLTSMGTLLADAYLFSLNANNKEYRIYFSTHQWLEEELRLQYQKISQDYLNKIVDLKSSFEEFRNEEEANVVFRVVEDESGGTKGLKINEASRLSIGANLVHPQRLNDMKAFVLKFTQKSKNLYNTKEISEKGK